MSDKFSSQDRALVIQELERIQKNSLASVPPSRKLFKDSAEIGYGISGDLMRQL
jgi:hypothetical protein